MQNILDLTGKIALITGASSGIGAAAAELMAEMGADVAITYRENRAGAEQVEAKVRSTGRRCLSIQADVKNQADIRKLVAAANSEFGPIDVLVNNAGSLIERVPLMEITGERWDEVLNLNLKSAVLCAQAVAPQMIDRKRGAIVNIVSIAGRNGGGSGAGAYSTAKGGMITFTKALAKELAPHGVRVNGVSPGVIDTPFHEVFSTPEMMRNFANSIPLGRIGASREVAFAIAFLASDAASYIVGETIEVNGGQLML